MTSQQIQNSGVRRLNALLQSIFRQQARAVAAMVRLDGEVPDLTPWIAATANAVKPLLLQMTQAGIIQSQRRVAGKLGARLPGEMRTHEVGNASAFKSLHRWVVQKTARHNTVRYDFNIFDPLVLDAVDVAAFAFCRETMATAQTDLYTALADLRVGMKQGLTEGQAQQWMSAKIGNIFADPYRAFRIATTESSRAVHAGQFMYAQSSGVTHKTWLASADACDRCLELNGKTVKLDEPFFVDSKGGPYSVVMHPPLHCFCFCTATEEINYGSAAA